MQPTILIVDDEKHTRDGLRRLLEDELRHLRRGGYSRRDGRAASANRSMCSSPICVSAGDDGMTLIERALKLPHPPICIMMTAYGSVDTAVEAMKRGAYDFVTKPLNLDKVEMLIARALGQPPARAGKSDAAPAGGRAICARKHHRRIAGVARGARYDPPGRALFRECFDRRRKRHGQGTGRARDSQFEPPEQGEIRHGALRGALAAIARERIVRPRTRRVHRRARTADRTVRAGERRHDFSR